MSSKLDHLVIGVDKDQFDKVVAWYLAALAPLNYEKIFDFGQTVGLGSKPKADVSNQTIDHFGKNRYTTTVAMHND